jgi:hypothetical protein
MNQFETRKTDAVRTTPSVMELSELCLDDLAAEIAQTLAACHALSRDSSARANDKDVDRSQ